MIKAEPKAGFDLKELNPPILLHNGENKGEGMVIMLKFQEEKEGYTSLCLYSESNLISVGSTCTPDESLWWKPYNGKLLIFNK